MSHIHVTTLGCLRIERDGEEVRQLPAQPVRCALFLFLALEREATRDRLATLFWPERDPERARRSLNQTLYELRLQLGDEWAHSYRDRVEVAGTVVVDALEFMAEVEAARDEEAFAAYGGAFLEGCHLGGTVEFQAWVDRRRAHLSRLHRTLCRRLVDARSVDGDLERALTVARRWAEMDPLEDEAHHRIIALLAETGRRSEALLHYQGYRELIAGELEVEPLDETKELVARIREGAVPLVASPEEKPVAAAPEAGPVPPSSSARGRTRTGLMAAIATALAVGMLLVWSGTNGGPSAVPSTENGALDPRGIAVLPFVNIGADPEKEYFSDGITEDLLASLSRIQDLRVISRTSVMRYKRTQLPIGEIARELGVRYIVEGSIRREDGQVRITAQLIDAASDAHLWAETYDRELTGIFRIQSEIAQRIAEQLRRRLVPADRLRIAGGGTAHIAAYDLLLRGREYLNRPGEADVRKYPPAMNFFRRALELDPAYTRAYVGLSEAFRSHVALPFTLRKDSARVYAAKAVALDPQSAEAAATLGLAYMMDGDWERAEEEFRRALELDSNQVEALSGRARLAWLNGRFDDAVRWQRRAVSADPFSAPRLSVLGGFLLNLGDLQGAERAYRRAIELSPDAPVSSFMLAQIHLIRGDQRGAEEWMRALEAAASGHPGTDFLLGRFHAQRGRFEAAEAHLARTAEALGGSVEATVSLQQAYVAKKLGQQDRAAELLARAEADLTAREREGARTPRLRLQLHALRGEPERALELMRRSWERELGGDRLAGPQIGLYWLDRDPLLEALHTDPAFHTLLRHIRKQLDSMRLRLNR